MSNSFINNEILNIIYGLSDLKNYHSMEDKEGILCDSLKRITRLYFSIINDYPTTEKRLDRYSDLFEQFRHDIDAEFYKQYYTNETETD